MLSSLRFRLKMFFKYKDLMILLVQRDVKLKYRRSFLGYIWSVLNPLLSMFVMVIVFSSMFSRGVDNFPVYLICGNVLFNFMREATNHAMSSIVTSASLLKKVYVPKYIFTVSKVTSALVNLVFSLGALLIVMVVTRATFSWYCLLIFIPILQLYLFCLGLGMFLAQANVFFRDIGNIWSVVTLAWMYLTPIFYDIRAVSPVLQTWIPRLNPMYVYVTQMREMILYARWPQGTLVWQGLLIALITMAVGTWTFTRSKDRFVLYI